MMAAAIKEIFPNKPRGDSAKQSFVRPPRLIPREPGKQGWVPLGLTMEAAAGRPLMKRET